MIQPWLGRNFKIWAKIPNRLKKFEVQNMNSDLENTLSLFCVLFKFIGSHCDKDGGVVTVCIGV